MVATLSAAAGTPRSSAGMHIALLAPGLRRRAIAAQALREGLLLSPLSASCGGPSPLRGFVLGFGNMPEARMEAAVKRLGKLVDEGSRRRPIPRRQAAP